jgi:hypothetical protein
VVRRKGERKEGKNGEYIWQDVVARIDIRSVNKMESVTLILRKSPMRNKSSLNRHITLKITGTRNVKYRFHENKLIQILIQMLFDSDKVNV